MSANPTEKLLYKRAVDWLLPPEPTESIKTFETQSASLDWIVAEYARDRYTGVLRSSDNQSKRRAALLLYKGRVVGCIRNSKSKPAVPQVVEALKQALADMRVAGVNIESYTLSEPKVLALSCFYFGVPLKVPELAEKGQSFLKVVEQIQRDKLTASIVQKVQGCSVLSAFHDGNHLCSFVPSEKQTLPDLEMVKKTVIQCGSEGLQAMTLPPDLVAKNYEGFGLKMVDFIS
jgi:hypothetical protein